MGTAVGTPTNHNQGPTMLLPLLPDECRTDLTDAGFPGLVAVWRPMDVFDVARWIDECKGDVESPVSHLAAVRRQIIRIEGIDVDEPGTDGEVRRVPFDAGNPEHLRRLPLAIVMPLYVAIVDRRGVTESPGE